MFLIWDIPNPFFSDILYASGFSILAASQFSTRFNPLSTQVISLSLSFHSISRFPLASSISNSISTQFLNRFLVISTRFHGIYFISTRFHVSSTLLLSIFLYFDSISHSVSQPFSRRFDSISRYPLPFDSISR